MDEGAFMRVGFVVERRAKDIEAQISVPENNEQSALVTYSQVGESFALLMGYLCYRSDRLAELMAACPQASLNECQVNDAALALAAYHHLGLASLERLEGDFALVIWDAETAQLIGLRDPLGGYPLFWIQHEKSVALSTSLRPLCARLSQCLLNEAYFAEFVMMQEARREGSSEQCVYQGIHRVLPGTMVIARADSDRIERRTYWDWLKHIKDPGTADLGEIAEQYRHLLRRAVQERMRGCTLAHLSGGMDSTSVALLAQDVVKAGIGTAPLHTVSLVYDRLAHLARERPYIESVLQREPEIVAHQLLGDDLLDFDIFSDPPLHDEPYTMLRSLTTGQHFVSLAAEIGALTILTGHGADEIHAHHPHSIANLLREQQFGKAWREATKWAKAENNSPWRIITTFGLNPLISTWAAGSRWADLLPKKDIDWSMPRWIRPDFARRHALVSRARENALQIYQQCEPTSLSVTLNSIKSRAGDVVRWSVAAPLGIASAHPFLDSRLLTFGLGMQSRIEPEPGRMKPVLAEAMRGRLPDEISSRRTKRGFNEVYYLGLGRNLANLEALVRQAPLEGMIDKERFIQHLQEGSLAGVPPRGLQHLSYMLSLLKWLSLQQEWLQVHEKVSLRLYAGVQTPTC
jgi:asparagine synthase (glutamine-hydrolysing)